MEANLSDKTYENLEIAQAVAATFDELAWKGASSHHLGKGLEHGVHRQMPLSGRDFLC